MTVFFGCNVFGADVQIDGLSYGRCPAEVVVSKGVHTIHVSYPPYYLDFKRRALFHTDKQTYVVALQITPEGEKQRRSGELFEKQKALIDAELSRYKKAGDVEDYVKKVIADGTAVYWKNSCSRIIITDGVADSIDFATPKVDGGVLQKGASSAEIGMKLRELLEAK
ncbi:MAG: PEGA domain-containing protein [Victivallales bacterium]|nr:PEGA domain-containing protein [Victivallales bacterium]